MRLEYECLPCIFRQTLEAGRKVTTDDDLIKEIIDQYAALIREINTEEITGPTLVAKSQQIVKDTVGVSDPYLEFKKKHMQLAQDLYPKVETIVTDAADSLFAALIMSAMGNAIDAGISLDIDVAASIKSAVDNGFVVSDFNFFEEQLEQAEEVLIIGDNSGEAVFDQLLIQELKKQDVEVIYAYRDEPVLNDVTINEVQEIGIDKLADRVLSSGCHTPGTVLTDISVEFKEVYQAADIVISKGQGNYEALSEAEREIFFLLKAKCEIVANLLDVAEGDLIFKLI
ncbi:MAG: damage-control phosphatase ARMT1 family protein [Bacillota bacterium]